MELLILVRGTGSKGNLGCKRLPRPAGSVIAVVVGVDAGYQDVHKPP